MTRNLYSHRLCFIHLMGCAKAAVAHLPVDASVVRDPFTSHMTVEMQFRNDPRRHKITFQGREKRG